MNKKYKLTEESIKFRGVKLFRIEALRDFTTVTGTKVKAGDKGGFIQSEDNLSQDGNGWVFENGRVIRGRVMHEGEMHGGEMHGGEMHGVMLGGVMHGGIMLGGVMHGGEVRGGDVVSRNPILIAGARWPVTITDNHILIGCQHHLIAKWQGFSDDEIAKMSEGALDFWKKWKDFIFQAIELSKETK